jgi:spermidine synthase
MAVLLLFFCSGATALVYEVIWYKYLALLFGSTIQAQTVVLAIFMGGLALGNRLFGRSADHSRRPLVIYGGIEIAIGIYAFFFPLLYDGANRLFMAWGIGLLDRPASLLLLKGVLSAGLLLGPTILMGGTLPMLAAWLQRNTPDASRRTARFYSINSLGAVCGAGLAGFFLVQWLGVRATMEATALASVLIGLTATAIGRRPATPRPADSPEPQTPASDPSEVTASAFLWSCALVSLTGGTSMGLEVLASRSLSLVLGASLQVFAIVLMAFILGIAAGSAVIASPRFRHSPKGITTIGLLLGAAMLIGLLVFNIENLAAVYSYAQDGLSRSEMGYRYHELLISAISIGVLGLPAAALGSVLPLWIRVAGGSKLLGDRVGRLLEWNTLGAVCGVLLTGFVLMPGIGLRGSFLTLAFVLVAAALVTALADRQRIALAAGTMVAILLVVGSVNGSEGWRYAMSAGVFRLPNGVYSRAFLAERRKSMDLLFYKDAADATVTVEQGVQPGGYTNLTLRIDGKPDASVPGDLSTQVLLGQLPMIMRPDSQDVFCLGIGSGVTAGTTLGYPIQTLTVADNCAPVLQAAKLFARWNNGVMTNARTHVYHEDGRTVLALSPRKYDVIISEPSNPWMVGIGSVFSRQFYEIAASRLKPGGVMSQWVFTYELNDDLLDLVIRTFNSVFPAMEIWDVGEGDIVLLGSERPWKSDLEVYRRPFEVEGPRRDLASIGLTSATAIYARQFASQQTAFALPGPGPLQTDNHPILEYEAPRGFYIFLGQGAQRFQAYDERTWQMELAPPGKNGALEQLDIAQLGAVFGGVAPSVNHDLESYLRDRSEGQTGSLVFGNRVMPCVFAATNTRTIIYAPPSAQTNGITRQLYFAEMTLRTKPAEQAEAIESIAQALNSVRDYNPQAADWSPAYYADLAAEASLRLGNAEQAKTILLRGLQLEPDSDQLRYFSRILIHRGILQPAEIPKMVANN